LKIRKIRPSIKNLQLTRPYTIATKTVSDVESVFLEIELDNGIVGIGAANPAVNVVGEGPQDSLVNLQTDTFERLLIGQDIRHFQRIIDAVDAAFPHKPGTLAAADLALHDAFGKYLDVPIAAFYGQYHHAMPTSVTIGIKNTADTLAEAAEYHAAGFRVLKVKTGLDVDEDVERIVRLRERYGDYFTIRVDANQGYNLAQLQQFLQQTRQTKVELVEQPLPVGAEAPLLQLPEADRLLLAADESLTDAGAALRWGAKPLHFGIYNIKLMKCGGIRGALAIANIAKAGGIDLFWGCNDESLVSITGALQVAFACPHTRYIDLDGSLDLAIDGAMGGFLLENGIMRLPESGGLGVLKV
jgi:L-Ala-D/L-Glu epimerase